MLGFALSFLLLAAAGRPLFYWGSRPAVVAVEVQRGRGQEAQLEEVAAVVDEGSLVFRLTFDRPLRQALYLGDGAPVSGRLRATVYVDADDDRKTGLDEGPMDLRTGADYRVDVGVLALGADAAEKRAAQALVTVALVAVQDGRRRTIWRADDASHPEAVSFYGESLDVRLPAGAVSAKTGARVILASGGRSADGRYKP